MSRSLEQQRKDREEAARQSRALRRNPPQFAVMIEWPDGTKDMMLTTDPSMRGRTLRPAPPQSARLPAQPTPELDGMVEPGIWSWQEALMLAIVVTIVAVGVGAAFLL